MECGWRSSKISQVLGWRSVSNLQGWQAVEGGEVLEQADVSTTRSTAAEQSRLTGIARAEGNGKKYRGAVGGGTKSAVLYKKIDLKRMLGLNGNENEHRHDSVLHISGQVLLSS